MAIDVDSIKAAYAAGIPTRDRLTGYSPADMKEILDRIHQMCKGYQKMEDGEEYYPNAKMKLSYGGEKGNDTPAINFILQRAVHLGILGHLVSRTQRVWHLRQI